MKKIIFLLITLLIVFTYACSLSSESSYDNTSVYHASSVSENEFVSQEDISVPEEEEKQEISEESVIQNITVYPENVTAEAAFAYCLDSHHFAYEKNTDVKINPASITKLLTVLYALEIAPKELVVTVGDELNLLQPYSSVAGIKYGRKYTLEQLIIAMLLPSGNDAAYSVAAGAARYATQQDLSAREAVDWFISNMNDYSVKLGCTDTHFTVPDGLAYEDHYTTSGDLVIIAENALKSEVISKYIALTEFSFTTENGDEHFWKNTNAHLHNDSPYYIECVTGMKTGSLGKYSLLVSAEINEKTYIIGILGASTHNERYENSTVIINALSEAEKVYK